MKDNNLSVILPIDNLSIAWPGSLKGAPTGAVLHPASISSTLNHSLEILKKHNNQLIQLKSLFGPQHGYLGQTQDNMVEWESFTEKELGIPIYSLYGKHREPTDQMLKGLEVLIIDLQDVGARYYTFIWTLFLCMKACARNKITFIVLDRPNPINAVTVEGEILDPLYTSFVGLHPIPPRHGKTIGQLAMQFKEDAFPDCDLIVLDMENYSPEMSFHETGLPWVMPSPNMPTLDTATVYPGMCLFEATNISEARGTTRPFEMFGAPFIDSAKMIRDLTRLDLPGVTFREAHFQPTYHKWKDEICSGAQIHVLDRNQFLPYKTAVEILRYIKKTYPVEFKWKEPPYEYETKKLPIEILIGGPVGKTFPD